MWAIKRDDEPPVYEMTSVMGVWQPQRMESGARPRRWWR